MKFNNEGLWKHAENIAYFCDKVINAMIAKNEPKTNVVSVINSINHIDGGCTKSTFVHTCTTVMEHTTLHTPSFKEAMKYALALPEKGEDINDNMTFPYFATLVKFNIACYKNDWDIKGNK